MKKTILILFVLSVLNCGIAGCAHPTLDPLPAASQAYDTALIAEESIPAAATDPQTPQTQPATLPHREPVATETNQLPTGPHPNEESQPQSTEPPVSQPATDPEGYQNLVVRP